MNAIDRPTWLERERPMCGGIIYYYMYHKPIMASKQDGSRWEQWKLRVHAVGGRSPPTSRRANVGCSLAGAFPNMTGIPVWHLLWTHRVNDLRSFHHQEVTNIRRKRRHRMAPFPSVVKRCVATVDRRTTARLVFVLPPTLTLLGPADQDGGAGG